MANKAPGKSHREGITLVQLMDMFPDETAATKWFEKVVWNGIRCCGHCGSTRTSEVPNAKPMPYWCADCRSYFSVRTGTAIAHSRVPLRKWAIAIYLELTSLKSISSMKLHRDIGVTQKTAWFMLHRIREAWNTRNDGEQFSGPVEVDETYMGGKRANMSNARRKDLAGTGRGSVGKVAVVGAKDRASNRVVAKVVTSTDKPTLQGFVVEHTAPGATVYSRACPSSTRASSTASPSTFAALPTPTAWNPSGACSSALTRAPSTRCLRSTLTGTCRNSPASTMLAIWTPPRRWPLSRAGSSASG